VRAPPAIGVDEAPLLDFVDIAALSCEGGGGAGLCISAFAPRGGIAEAWTAPEMA
jgi:hypothetical protein